MQMDPRVEALAQVMKELDPQLSGVETRAEEIIKRLSERNIHIVMTIATEPKESPFIMEPEDCEHGCGPMKKMAVGYECLSDHK